jgi:hypothetical protein
VEALAKRDPADAERLARTITDPRDQAWALTKIANVLNDQGAE